MNEQYTGLKARVLFIGGILFMKVEVKCNRCRSAATILDSNVISGDVKALYCKCRNALCGHRFVSTLEFSHTLSPSAFDFPPEVLEKLRAMNQQQVKALLVLCNQVKEPEPEKSAKTKSYRRF